MIYKATPLACSTMVQQCQGWLLLGSSDLRVILSFRKIGSSRTYSIKKKCIRKAVYVPLYVTASLFLAVAARPHCVKSVLNLRQSPHTTHTHTFEPNFCQAVCTHPAKCNTQTFVEHKLFFFLFHGMKQLAPFNNLVGEVKRAPVFGFL